MYLQAHYQATTSQKNLETGFQSLSEGKEAEWEVEESS